jgi:FeS assembly SUF system protein
MSDLATAEQTTTDDAVAELDAAALGVDGDIPSTTEITGRADLIAPVIAALRTVYDPEIPVNIFDLGLVYKLAIAQDGVVDITMTLTAPGCPVAEEMPGMLRDAVMPVEGVEQVDVGITWDPPWTMNCMTEDARLALGMF